MLGYKDGAEARRRRRACQTPTADSLYAPRPRRFLLAADPAARIYLDLATGAEVVEPAPATPAMPRTRKPAEPDPSPSSWPPPLADTVARCLTDLEFRFNTDGDGTIRIPFQGKLMNAEVQIATPEDRRDLIFRLDLQVAVPKAKEEALLRAVEVLNRTYCVAQLLFNENRRTIEAYHPVFLADLEPTPAFIWEQLRVVMHNHDVIHHTLADFLFNAYPPEHIEQKARGFEEGLMMLWLAQETDEANDSNES